MTIQQMEYFFSVASLLSFNKAAKVNYTSASTITRQIAALEAVSSSVATRRKSTCSGK